MTTTVTTSPQRDHEPPSPTPELPLRAHAAAVVKPPRPSAAGVAAGALRRVGSSTRPASAAPVLTGRLAAVLFLVGLGAAATAVEGGRSARNRTATSLIYSALPAGPAPLLSVAWTLISKGTDRLDRTSSPTR